MVVVTGSLPSVFEGTRIEADKKLIPDPIAWIFSTLVETIWEKFYASTNWKTKPTSIFPEKTKADVSQSMVEISTLAFELGNAQTLKRVLSKLGSGFMSA